MNIELPSLYAHQVLMKDRSRAALTRDRRVILCAPPGTGKTRLAKWILGASANRVPNDNQTGKVLFAVQKRGLVDNASNSFLETPELPHGVVMSGSPTAWGERVQVASIDTLLSWFVKPDGYDSNITFDLIVYDETHSHLPKLTRFLNHHDQMRLEQGKHPAYVLGLTATPQCKGLADVYADIIPGPPPQWLIDNRFLSPFKYLGGKKGRLGQLIKRGGEFTKSSVDAAFAGMQGDMVRDWLKYAAGRPTVGFFPRRSHAKEAQQDLIKAGLRTAYVDGDTSDEERHRIFWELDNGNLDYLCNVQVVERGTDIPAIACVQLCVAIGSLTRYLQMIGRGSRVHSSKADCLVLDHGGNVSRHGLFEDDQHWSLDMSRSDSDAEGSRPTIECPQCSAIYRGGRCRECGYEPTPKERTSQGLEFDGEELRPITKKSKDNSALDPQQLMCQALFVAGQSGRSWKQAVRMFYRECEKQGKRHRVPKTITIAGHRYLMLPAGHPKGGRKVAGLFPVTVKKGHGGEFDLGPITADKAGIAG